MKKIKILVLFSLLSPFVLACMLFIDHVTDFELFMYCVMGVFGINYHYALFHFGLLLGGYYLAIRLQKPQWIFIVLATLVCIGMVWALNPRRFDPLVFYLLMVSDLVFYLIGMRWALGQEWKKVFKISYKNS